MINARQVAAALVECGDDQWYVVGATGDIQQLYDAGFTLQVWDIRLDNGHRPYPIARRWVNYPETEKILHSEEINSLTQEIVGRTSLTFAGNLFGLEETFLFRPTSTFWEEFFLQFADPDGKVHGVDPAEFYAIYRGYVNRRSGTIKFIRVEPGSADYMLVTPARLISQ